MEEEEGLEENIVKDLFETYLPSCKLKLYDQLGFIEYYKVRDISNNPKLINLNLEI